MSRAKLGIALLVIVLLLPSISPNLSLRLIPKVHATTTSFTLFAAYSGWNFSKPSGANPPITVTKGDTVSFNLISGDSLAHLLLIDFDGNGVTNDCTGGTDKCSGNIPVGGTSSIAPFVVTAKPGQYSYYCLYHSPGAMVGIFVVQSPPGPDYSVSSNPSSLTILQGVNENSTISVTSVNNFGGSITLSATTPPTWPSPNFSVNPVTVSAGMTSTSKLTIYVPSGASPGQYNVPVTARNSTTSRSTTIAVTVPTPDFSVSANPTSVTVNSGSTGGSAITIAGSNGFSGNVTLAATVPLSQATVALSPTSVLLSSTTTSATSALTISSPLGTFNVTITGTSGGTSHSVQVQVNGPDFTLKTSSTTISVDQGASSTLTITISSINGFSGSVTLTALSSKGGPPASLAPSTLQVSSGGSATSTLTVTASTSGPYAAAVSAGSYTLTLNATMGSLFHVETIPLTVNAPPLGIGILANPIAIGGIVAAIVILGIVIYALRRRPKK